MGRGRGSLGPSVPWALIKLTLAVSKSVASPCPQPGRLALPPWPGSVLSPGRHHRPLTPSQLWLHPPVVEPLQLYLVAGPSSLC